MEGEVDCIESPSAAWELAKAELKHGSSLCVTGSFFLAAELIPLIRSQWPVTDNRSKQSGPNETVDA